MRNRQDRNEAVHEGWQEVFGTYNLDWLFVAECDEADSYSAYVSAIRTMPYDGALVSWTDDEHRRSWCELEMARECASRFAKNRARARCAVRWLAHNR